MNWKTRTKEETLYLFYYHEGNDPITFLVYTFKSVTSQCDGPDTTYESFVINNNKHKNSSSSIDRSSKQLNSRPDRNSSTICVFIF